MGKAIVIDGVDYSQYGLGQVTVPILSIIPNVLQITEATIFSVIENGTTIQASWSIDDSTLASLVENPDGTATVTPLIENNTVPVTLTATVAGSALSITFVPLIIVSMVWYIDRCTNSPSPGSLYNANLVNGGWAYMETDQNILRGKKINRMKILPFQAGVFNIYRASSLNGPVTLAATITITADEIDNVTIYSFEEFTLGPSEFIVFGQSNSQGGFQYISYGGSSYTGFYSKVPSSSPSEASSANELNFSVGYYGMLND